MALAATVGDKVSNCRIDGSGTLVSGHDKLTIEGHPVSCISDQDNHGHTITSGSRKLFVEGVAVARIGDHLNSGGVIASGKKKLDVRA